MADGIRVAFAAVRELAYSSIGAGFAAVGSATADYTRQIYIANSTNADVYISLNNSTNHIKMVANSFRLLDLMSNRTDEAPLFLAKGTTFYAKRVSGAPTSGTLWIEVMYAEGGL